MSKWIKCSEQLPEIGELVLGAWGGMVGEVQLKENGKWVRYGVDISLWTGKKVTHWMALPDLPKD